MEIEMGLMFLGPVCPGNAGRPQAKPGVSGAVIAAGIRPLVRHLSETCLGLHCQRANFPPSRSWTAEQQIGKHALHSLQPPTTYLLIFFVISAVCQLTKS